MGLEDQQFDSLELWEQQPNETGRAYAAFSHYLAMKPHERSLRKLSLQLYADELNGDDSEAKMTRKNDRSSYFSTLAKFSAKYNWVKRAQARDIYLRRITFKEQEEAIKETSKRQAMQTKTVAAALTLPATAIVKKNKEIFAFIEKAKITPELLELMMKISVASARELPKIIESEVGAHQRINSEKSREIEDDDLPPTILMGSEIEAEFEHFMLNDTPSVYVQDELGNDEEL